ncbi:MAG TPA: hypothetical protein VLI05_00365 [Candidatus Saccharimonadia bacterium]|nr:hypothetical protein [Candidatus Saccharimonadia bacterium]
MNSYGKTAPVPTIDAIYTYPPEVLEQARTAATLIIPKGRHVGAYGLEWLKGLDGLAIPEQLSDLISQRVTTHDRTFECLRDCAITESVDRAGVMGVTAFHQFIEQSAGTGPNLRASTIATLMGARFVLAVRQEEHDQVLQLVADRRQHKRLRVCSEYHAMAQRVLATYDLQLDVDKVATGSSEVRLGRRHGSSPWNMAVVIVGSGQSLRNTGLVELRLRRRHSLPRVQLCAIWRETERKRRES